uniref:Uncharacterized protein n=1 Tax=Arundo donax TaxID=35708 RepID=A0A0A9CVA4_ARUDO
MHALGFLILSRSGIYHFCQQAVAYCSYLIELRDVLRGVLFVETGDLIISCRPNKLCTELIASVHF